MVEREGVTGLFRFTEPPSVARLNNKRSWDFSQIFLSGEVKLKVPKCEIFHLFDFNDFYGIKSL